MTGSRHVRLKLRATNVLAGWFGWLGRSPGRLRALTFHDVGDDEADLFAVSRKRFADYLRLLQEEGYVTIRARDILSEWPSWMDRDRVVLLTFDDGYVSHRDVVADMLGQHGMTATFFVVSSFVGPTRTSRHFEGSTRDFLSIDDLRGLERDGFEVGSHTHTHALLGGLPESAVVDELTRSRELLEGALNCAVRSFAYPYGRQGATSPRTRAALVNAGYEVAFTQTGIRIERSSDMLALPRTSVDRLDTITTFRRKLAGDYDLLGSLRRYARPSPLARVGEEPLLR